MQVFDISQEVFSCRVYPGDFILLLKQYNDLHA